jgi:flagellum-specific peptidoglycan hydrolase FlgJ
MIRLKQLIHEQTKAPIRVLFIGDHQTKVSWSYARELIASKPITGRAAGWANATTEQLYRILRNRLSKRYDVVVIMGGDADAKSKSDSNAISNLQRCYELAKKYGAKVVAISNPSKIFLKPGDKNYSETLYPVNDQIANWVNSQNITDATIDTTKFKQDDFANDNYTLNRAANRVIADELRSIIDGFNIKPRSVAVTKEFLSLGDSGKEVEALHEQLETIGFSIAWMESLSNTFGPSTFLAITTIQKEAGVPVTGMLDTATQELISSLELKAAEGEDEDASGESQLSGSRTEYIKKYADIAMEQMKLHDIPASIILAQGALESANGTSGLTVQAKNHFGMKGSYNGQQWCGNTSEYVNGVKVKVKACFRKYNTDQESFDDHSKLLKGSRYQTKVKEMASGVSDYKGWAKALQAAGYATSPTYADTLIDLIEQNDLQQYDVLASGGKNTLNKSSLSAVDFKPQPSKTFQNGKISLSLLKLIEPGHQLEPAAADAYLAMKEASLSDGLKETDWDISDSYRTYEVQNAIFDWDLYNRTGAKAKKGSGGRTAAAYPGTSNHGLGKAIDLWGKAQEWVRKNGERFGWSWDEGKAVGEPWHFRYKF